MKVAVIGLGKLGSVLAAVLAEAGHVVVGVDLNPSYADAINAKRAPVQEPGLQELIDQIPDGRLRATTSHEDAISGSELSMIVVPTPSGEDGGFVNDHILDAIKEIGANVPNSWHTVVVCSTVMPGAMESIIQPALEEAAGRTVGSNLGLCYSPEFIALGSVVKDMKKPDAVFIGAQDNCSKRHLRCLVESYVLSRPTYHEMTFTEAELAKIGVNTYVTMKISYANTIAEICEQLPGTSAKNVLDAVGADGRIGKSYLAPGASFGGPCFPRDNRAFVSLAESVGAAADLAIATDKANQRVAERVALDLLDHDSVAILGLSYKPMTPVVEESMGLSVATILHEQGKKVRVHDPMAKPQLPAGITRYETIEGVLQTATAVVVATPWSVYRDIHFGGRLVIDAWDCTLAQANRRVLGTHCWWWPK